MAFLHGCASELELCASTQSWGPPILDSIIAFRGDYANVISVRYYSLYTESIVSLVTGECSQHGAAVLHRTLQSFGSL